MPERQRAAWIGAAVVAAGLTLVGCSGGGASDSARSAADTVASAAPTLDYAKANTVLCPALMHKSELEVFGLNPYGVNNNVKYTFANSTKTDDTSYQVAYKVSLDADTGFGSTRHLDGVTTFTVKKEGDAWKVCGAEPT